MIQKRFTSEELAMQFSHFNNGSLELTYLTDLTDMTLNFFPQNIVPTVPNFEESQVQINYSKLGTSATKFCEEKFKVIRSW